MLRRAHDGVLIIRGSPCHTAAGPGRQGRALGLASGDPPLTSAVSLCILIAVSVLLFLRAENVATTAGRREGSLALGQLATKDR
jgi:hypothetical protein